MLWLSHAQKDEEQFDLLGPFMTFQSKLASIAARTVSALTECVRVDA